MKCMVVKEKNNTTEKYILKCVEKLEAWNSQSGMTVKWQHSTVYVECIMTPHEMLADEGGIKSPHSSMKTGIYFHTYRRPFQCS